MPADFGAVLMTKRPAATATMKVDPELLRKAKQHAALNDIKIQDYIDALLRKPIERDHAHDMRRIVEESKGKDGKS